MEQKKFEYNETNYDGGVNLNSCACDMNYIEPQTMMMCPPIHECPQERVCHRYICYEVPHIMPCNTRVVNHHIYKHTYTPCYTTCEENVVSNIHERNCCF